MKSKIFALSLLASGLALGAGVASAAGVTVTKVAVAAPAVLTPVADTSDVVPAGAANYSSEAAINNDAGLTPKQKLLLLIWYRHRHPGPSFD